MAQRFAHRLMCGALLIVCMVALLSCDEEEGPLAPYEGGSQALSTVVIEDSTFVPRITWVGGYVSAFGINRGSRAVLDSSLVWLVKAQGNTLRYPVVVGKLPEGAQDLTATYGGIPVSELVEDEMYTFWVMKEDVWTQVTAEPGKQILADSTGASTVRVSGDSVFVPPTSHVQKSDTVDIFVNIKEVDPRGRLAMISVEQTDSSNNPMARFTIIQSGVADSLVAAIGLVQNSGVYNVNNVVWEVLSEKVVNGTPQYRTKNIIGSPLTMGQSLPETFVFVPYPAEGLQRNRLYYLWIATKEWDGLTRDTRTANYYAWVTFRTW